MKTSWLRCLIVLGLMFGLASCKNQSDAGNTADLAVGASQKTVVISPQVYIKDYVLVSSTRVGRTITEYTLRAIVTNPTASAYSSVTATLVSVPPNITIIQGKVTFGDIAANSTTTSQDTFIIDVDLSVAASLGDMVWQVEGVDNGGGSTTTAGTPGIYMSIDSNAIEGDATDRYHKDWISLLSYGEGSSYNGGSQIGGGGTRTGKISFTGLNVSKKVDVSSPALRAALAGGQRFTEVKIDDMRSCGGNVYTAYAITLTGPVLSSLQMSGSADTATEALNFQYSRIQTMYTPVDANCRLGTPVYSYQDAGYLP